MKLQYMVLVETSGLGYLSAVVVQPGSMFL